MQSSFYHNWLWIIKSRLCSDFINDKIDFKITHIPKKKKNPKTPKMGANEMLLLLLFCMYNLSQLYNTLYHESIN